MRRLTVLLTGIMLAQSRLPDGDKNGSGIRFPRISGKTDPGTLMLRRAALIWICIVPVAIINGLVRDLMLVPMLGDPIARAVSALTLAGAVLLIARASIRWIAPAATSEAWTIGLVWLVLTLAFEFVVGHYVFGAPWETLRADYNILAGRLWVVVLAAALATPRLVYRRAISHDAAEVSAGEGRNS